VKAAGAVACSELFGAFGYFHFSREGLANE
jgi:hypothetical protein